VHIAQSVVHLSQPLGAVQQTPLGALDDPAAQFPFYIRQQHAEELLHLDRFKFVWISYENNLFAGALRLVVCKQKSWAAITGYREEGGGIPIGERIITVLGKVSHLGTILDNIFQFICI